MVGMEKISVLRGNMEHMANSEKGIEKAYLLLESAFTFVHAGQFSNAADFYGRAYTALLDVRDDEVFMRDARTVLARQMRDRAALEEFRLMRMDVVRAVELCRKAAVEGTDEAISNALEHTESLRIQAASVRKKDHYEVPVDQENIIKMPTKSPSPDKGA